MNIIRDPDLRELIANPPDERWPIFNEINRIRYQVESCEQLLADENTPPEKRRAWENRINDDIHDLGVLLTLPAVVTDYERYLTEDTEEREVSAWKEFAEQHINQYQNSSEL